MTESPFDHGMQEDDAFEGRELPPPQKIGPGRQVDVVNGIGELREGMGVDLVAELFLPVTIPQWGEDAIEWHSFVIRRSYQLPPQERAELFVRRRRDDPEWTYNSAEEGIRRQNDEYFIDVVDRTTGKIVASTNTSMYSKPIILGRDNIEADDSTGRSVTSRRMAVIALAERDPEVGPNKLVRISNVSEINPIMVRSVDIRPVES